MPCWRDFGASNRLPRLRGRDRADAGVQQRLWGAAASLSTRRNRRGHIEP